MKTGIEPQKIKGYLGKTEYKTYEIAPVEKGVSTDVFRLTSQDKKNTLYLRIPPKREGIGPQELAHKLMLERDVNIPKVVFSQTKVRSINYRDIMITEEIKGSPVSQHIPRIKPNQLKTILRDAGRQLAKINSIPVKGVGWINNSRGNTLIADGQNYNDFTIERLNKHLEYLHANEIVTRKTSQKIKDFISSNTQLFDTVKTSFLAHGDFCLEHVYNLNGKYAGIIDFGDIRGASKYHDLSHFYTYEKECFDQLIDGYREIYNLPENYKDYIFAEAVLFGVGKLWYKAKHTPHKLKNHPVFELFARI